jgi:hypothetical protein
MQAITATIENGVHEEPFDSILLEVIRNAILEATEVMSPAFKEPLIPQTSRYGPLQLIIHGKLPLIVCVWLTSSQRTEGVCATSWLEGSFVRIFSDSGSEAWTVGELDSTVPTT